MKKILLFFLIVSVCQAQKSPKLVVGIVVDQMKMDYIYRFENDFSPNGFKRLMNDGFTFYNMHYNFMPTYTAPGHAAIYTGTTPATNGIVANNWYVRKLKKEIYCTVDDSVNGLGDATVSEGKMSPKNLQTTTITDELKLSTNFKGKVFGISLKDRGAILPAGHFANWAFWYANSGAFVSSDFYGKELPKWVEDFNREKNYLQYTSQNWSLLKPISVYDESLEDNSKYEGLLNGEKPNFPYDTKKMFDKVGASYIRSTPFGNELMANFAKKCIENEALGKDEITDFLTLSFSSTDYIGHILGARSIEIQDTYLRLDLTIADLLKYLDKTVGKGNYLVFLTADHAGAENAQLLKDKKYNVDHVDYQFLGNQLRNYSKEIYKEDLVLNYSNFSFFLNNEIINQKNLDLTLVKQKFREFLEAQDIVKRVYTREEILTANDSDYYLKFLANGYDNAEKPDLVILEKPGYIEYGATGTSHGTVYNYDTHVPCIFYGWNIKKGKSHDKKEITEIAPTLAQKLNINFPNASNTNVLEEILK